MGGETTERTGRGYPVHRVLARATGTIWGGIDRGGHVTDVVFPVT